ncbi:MAG TPA: hypothetical protein VKA70_18880 [Blastocatellia bacterium]|nr:hypothetical protein [Blastocatellia bacterium]
MRTTIAALAVIAIMVMTSLTGRVEAAAGDLDTSFGSGGIVSTAFGEYENQFWDVAVQADGRIVAVGAYNSHLAITRYNPDGTLDQTFGIGGKVVTDILPFYAHAQTVAIQPNGKIITGGYRRHQDIAAGYFALARYNTDGSLDTTFGTGGIAVAAFSNDDWIFDLALQPDGRIVAVGHTGSPNQFRNLAVVRYNANGSVDTSFATGGMFEMDFFGHGDIASSVVIQPDGRILVGGSASHTLDGDYDSVLVRLNTNGSLDTTFGWFGIVITDFFGTNNTTGEIALLPDGRILAGGSADNGLYKSLALIRYNPDGSLDTTFGSDGKMIAFLSPSISCNGADLEILPNGKIIMAGGGHSTRYDFLLARFNSDGSVNSYGSGDYVLTDFFGGDEGATAMALYGNDQVIAVGITHHFYQGGYHASSSMARYKGDGAPTSANLAVAMSASLSQDRITYTITVSNYGPDPSYFVTLKDTIPDDTTFQSLTVPQGWVVYSKPAAGHPGTVSVSRSKAAAPNPPFTTSATFTLVVKVNSGVRNTTITNRASVASSFTNDLYTPNNKAVTQTHVP